MKKTTVLVTDQGGDINIDIAADGKVLGIKVPQRVEMTPEEVEIFIDTLYEFQEIMKNDANTG